MLRQKFKRNALELCLIVAFLASVGITWVTAKTGRIALAGLVAVPGEIQLGDVVQEHAIPFDYQLENRGGKAVVTEVTRPCTCTELDLATGASLHAGSTLRVRGTVDTLFRRGAFETAIAVTYRLEGIARDYTLAIPVRMFVKPSIACSNDVITIRQDYRTTLDLSAGMSSSFRITAIEASDPYICWETDGPGLGEECSKLRLKFWLDRSRLAGPAVFPSGGHWVEFTTSVASEPRFRLPVSFESSEGKQP